MTVEQFYIINDEDYQEILGRLAKPERIVKYLKKYAESTYLDEMHAAIEAQNWEEAFRMIHSIKGVGLNLGLQKFVMTCSPLCEALRNGAPAEPIEEMIEAVNRADISLREDINLID